MEYGIGIDASPGLYKEQCEEKQVCPVQTHHFVCDSIPKQLNVKEGETPNHTLLLLWYSMIRVSICWRVSAGLLSRQGKGCLPVRGEVDHKEGEDCGESLAECRQQI